MVIHSPTLSESECWQGIPAFGAKANALKSALASKVVDERTEPCSCIAWKVFQLFQLFVYLGNVCSVFDAQPSIQMAIYLDGTKYKVD
ncbi:hypothetical protein CEXT_440901 [Caerostris extrusa]|uniref:Uncharacterized protein n=1 Tax=Caerostris extrusa TaxID=172846 RepID=A0AAV4R0F7_CAEEX|nr:hypothetical protein CEXT_440901 [Caerostris extrusa]